MSQWSMRLLALILLLAPSPALAQTPPVKEQYPTPLIHTSTNHPADHVLIVAVDQLQAADLADWVKQHPASALAELSRRGVTYTNAHLTWSDRAAGLLALATGGTPISTGILNQEAYDRGQSPNQPLTPQQKVRVKGIFEAVHAAGGRTVWAGLSQAETDLLRGPTNTGLDEAFWPTTPSAGDPERVQTLLAWLTPKDQTLVPRLAGLDLSEPLPQADRHLAGIIATLKQQSLFDSTWIVVTSTHGHPPAAIAKPISPNQIEAVAGSEALHIELGEAALIWLRDPSTTRSVAARYRQAAARLGIGEIYFGERLDLLFNPPAEDSRMPDLILEPRPGTSWQGTTQGGMNASQTHVALLIAGHQITGRQDKTPVPTTQIAALIMRILGMEKLDLPALHIEHSPALPGIF